MSAVFVNILPLLGGDHIDLDPEWLQEEEAWATQHAMRWAASKKFDALEITQFATYFAEGWMNYLKEDSDSIDASMMQLLRQFRRETAKDE